MVSRGSLVLAALTAGLLAFPAAAAAQDRGASVVLGAPNLNAPGDPINCDAKCTVIGHDPGTPAPEHAAPFDGTVERVSVRTDQVIDVELVEMSLVGTGIGGPIYRTDAIHPLGTTEAPTPANNGVTDFDAFFEIEVESGTLLGLNGTPTSGGPGKTFEYYTVSAAEVGVVDPAPAAGGQGEADGIDDGLIAAQIEIAQVTPPPPPPRADLAVTKTAAPGLPPAVGEDLIFDVVVTNNGPKTADGILLGDRYGRGLELVDTETLAGSAGAAACGLGGPGIEICALGSLAPGASIGLEFKFKVTGRSSKGAGKGSKRREPNSATVASLLGPPDPNLANNTATASKRIEGGGPNCNHKTETGTSGKDKLTGGRRRDTLLGLAGNDELKGKQRGDCLFGHEDDDRLAGNGGRDYYSGGSGRDKIRARDGARDEIECGKGRDKVLADRRDKVAKDCEKVKRR